MNIQRVDGKLIECQARKTTGFAARCLLRISDRVDQLIADAILGWVGAAIKLGVELRTHRMTVHPVMASAFPVLGVVGGKTF